MEEKEITVIDGDVSKCDHRATSKTTSLKFLKSQFLVYPQKIYAVCSECGKGFCFMKSKRTGNWVHIKEQKKGGDQ